MLIINLDIWPSNIRPNVARNTKDDPMISIDCGTSLVNIMFATKAITISVDLKVEYVAGCIIWRDLYPKKNPMIPEK